MLTLSRKKGEEIVIDDGRIVVTVLGFRGLSTVSLGITAPPDVPILRKEVFDAIKREPKGGEK